MANSLLKHTCQPFDRQRISEKRLQMPLRLHQIVKDHRPFCCEAETCERGSVAAHLRAVNSSDKKVLFFSVLPILEQQRVPFELSAIITIGDDRDRTDNLCLARAALSQLSYVPEIHPFQLSGRTWTRTTDLSFIRAAL